MLEESFGIKLSRSSRRWVVGVAVAFVVAHVLVVAVWLALPSVSSGRGPTRRSMCMNHLKQIGFALHNYHDQWGSFPPAVTYGPDGEPWHSWRVLILPYLDQSPLYDQYDFDEPWDGPNNLSVTRVQLHVYQCPSANMLFKNETHYFAVTGANTVFPPSGCCSLNQITDGSSNSLATFERSGSDVPWAAPIDPVFDPARLPGDPFGSLGARSYHSSSCQFLFCDGAVRGLSPDIPPDTFRNLVEINDGTSPVEF
ncbi:DUF1559 family PulG-like putative transporter [Stratiformator vulcanicus]|uniref:DUF1559 domain-containing protein n=1 Tax=Stratiformator vulcanicus TaxID=2527980 RepID=A0A517QX84_9PLAN|nr:DUF1559 domain-containing protein [Stratiformator vulcanicus]QDT36272.1 hypothetical protein Pan189_06280 [Stratiformator vulcanicus]